MKSSRVSRDLSFPSSYFVGIGASADGSQLREDTFNGISYIVVPIVSAVGDQVWWPINSPAPVLILSSVLATHAQTRNFRPVVMGHPKISGDYVSANSPDVLQDYQFGFMFNSVFDDGRVKVEAWLDPIRAKEVGPAAENVIVRLQAGENVEVSEGNAVLAIKEDGIFNGKEYGIRWISAVSDHLAMLDVGKTGACNNEMGCGRLQVSQDSEDESGSSSIIVLSASNDIKASATANKSKGDAAMKDSIFGRMLAKIRASMSNNDLRWKLYQAVSELEPGVQYVDDEDVAAGTFRYVVVISYGYSWDDDSEREYHWYQRSFTVNADNSVSVNDDRVELVFDQTKAWVVKAITTEDTTETEVEAETEVVVVESEAAPIDPNTSRSSISASCNCHNKNKGESTMKPTVAQKNLASQLIASSVAPFEESDRDVLEAMSEEKLKTLAAKFEDEKPEVAASTANTAAAPAPVIDSSANSVTLTREEYAQIKAAADAHSQQIAARKAHLVTSLKNAQSGLTETDLNEMNIDTLEKLAVSFGVDSPTVADYSLRGVPASRTSTSVSERALPDTWGLNSKTN